MDVISGLFRRPAAASILSLLGVLSFYVVIGGVDLGKLMGAASWVNYAARIGVVALFVGLLMISGEIDISIGAMIPAGAMTTAILSGYYELPMIVGILGALAMGVIVGLFNGLLVTRTTVPSLIVTLGTLVAMQGIVLAGSKLLTGAASVPLSAPGWAKTVFGDLMFGGNHQVVIVWWIALAVVVWFVMHQTKYGNWIFAIGGDKVSARNAGIPVDWIKIGLFVGTATSAAFVGMCHAILFNSAQVSGGMNDIFNIIVSVVVGGVLLTGGFGSIPGVVIGTVTFAIVTKGIDFTSIDRNWSNLIIGIMLLAAVGMNETFRAKAMSAVRKKKG
ncbi:monosaccharide ABC transporter membrane protein (CUT2 family) [Rhodobacter aestuarii]|uniref:Xylose transport system permease protein XylH n=1 Tax=Rhodobacter aestuarii TaxID=453582 RepID=A0A1N7QHC9_9RHOB|nr:ABC transporter permease [Rhodobacter aestuarii]PTV93361.1 monosaccharide ABC transporter membrane protein (CUT2 family) [Rhodobacter aestuarii]SIT22238.1 monosaccharide ABC transporter membrane protein, CUT2 family [Rhodobacter aestuarii]